MIECFAPLSASKLFILHFREFELTAEGQKHKEMTCSYKDIWFSERLTFEIYPPQLIDHYTQSVASRVRRSQRTIISVCVWQTPLIFHLSGGGELRFQERCDFKLGSSDCVVCLNLIGQFGMPGSTGKHLNFENLYFSGYCS